MCTEEFIRMMFTVDLYGNRGLDSRIFKGVLHPRPVFGLFMHFSQNLQHIGNK